MSEADAVKSLEEWLELKGWRKRTRLELLRARASLTAETHSDLSNRVIQRLIEVLNPLSIKLIGVYWPIQGEIDVLPFVEHFVAKGGLAALPMVVGKNRPLEFRRWTPGDVLVPGVYNIPYPAEAEAADPDALVVPLVGFDAGCYRLGYGGGYYDRTLAAMSKRPLTIGVGFSGGHLETIYPQPFDVPMDYILTEDATVRR